ncbi:MAG: alpha-amylase family glycosyl hydrolase, partial [Desulfotignum sp.]
MPDHDHTTLNQEKTKPGDISLLSEDDLFLFNEGSHFCLYDKLGAHPMKVGNQDGFYFAVWAPNAKAVFVMGSFNDWHTTQHPLTPRANSGIWEGFIPGIRPGTLYKYHIRSTQKQYQVDKTDPFAFFTELSPQTASVTWDLAYEWSDDTWMENRSNVNVRSSPMAVYEMHLGSWIRIPEENNRFATYRELAEKLPDYLLKMGFTHVEFLPVMEHPFYGSWGYQCLGYFAPSSRFGTPQDFMGLVDCLHQKNIGVILDWVPSHFPSDEHGLGYFDGTHLFEHEDPRKGFHPDWKSLIFN